MYSVYDLFQLCQIFFNQAGSTIYTVAALHFLCYRFFTKSLHILLSCASSFHVEFEALLHYAHFQQMHALLMTTNTFFFKAAISGRILLSLIYALTLTAITNGRWVDFYKPEPLFPEEDASQ